MPGKRMCLIFHFPPNDMQSYDFRKLAHFLILEANGVLNEGAHDVPAPAPVPSPSRKKTAPSSGRKRTLDLDAVADTRFVHTYCRQDPYMFISSPSFLTQNIVVCLFTVVNN